MPVSDRFSSGTGTRFFVLVALFFVIGLPPHGARSCARERATLTLENTRFSDEFSAGGFSADWCDTSGRRCDAYYELQGSGESWGGTHIVRVEAASGEKTVLVNASELVPEGATGALSVSSFAFSDSGSLVLVFTNTKRVWRRHTRGDYWVLDRSARQLRKLGAAFPESTLMFAKFSPDEKRVAYVQGGNIYVEEIMSGAVTAMTGSGGERYINGTFDWVYEEEFGLRDGFRWSPDGRMIAFWQLDTEGVAVHTLVDNINSFYPKITQFKYPRAGTTNPAARIGVVQLDRPGEESIQWIPIPGDPREHYLVSLDWLGGERTLLIRQMNRLQNRMTFWVVPEEYVPSGPEHPVAVSHLPYQKFDHPISRWTETDAAWIDMHELHWLPDGRSFVTASERDGWRHLYFFDLSTSEVQAPKRLTGGDWDVIDFAGFDYGENGTENIPETETKNDDENTHGKNHFENQSDGEKHRRFPLGTYFYASPENATQKYLYRVDFDGGNLRRISPEARSGTHTYAISPGGRFAFHTYGSYGNPPTHTLVRLPSHEIVKTCEDNAALRKKLDAVKLGKTEFFTVDIPGGGTSGDGFQEQVSLDGWCVYPHDFDPTKRYPVLVHVYGEPAGQTVLDRWEGRNYLWHQMLAGRGFFVVSYDNRGTPAPKGRTWRKSAYRKIGTLGPADQAAALRATLQARPYLDAGRVGIWGWSGGGSMSLHAIFQYPELYKTAVAVAPVPNERYYDTIYQERYMGLPGENGNDYRNSSPVTYANRLRGNLLVLHGTGDDNTHYQTVELLFDELIRHEKQFSMMIYPNRTHGISEGPGTTRHLWKCITDYILEKI